MVWLVETKRLPTGKSSNARFTPKHCCIVGEDARCKLCLTRQHDRPGIDGLGHCPVPESLSEGGIPIGSLGQRARERPIGPRITRISRIGKAQKGKIKRRLLSFSSALSATVTDAQQRPGFPSAVQRNDRLRQSFNRSADCISSRAPALDRATALRRGGRHVRSCLDC